MASTSNPGEPSRPYDRLLELQIRQADAIERLTTRLTVMESAVSRLAELERRLTRLEDREDSLVERVRGEARAVASESLIVTTSEMARRIGVLEGRSEGVSLRRELTTQTHPNG